MLHFSFLIFFLGTSYIYLTLLSRSEISEQNKQKQNICINLYRVCHNGHTILWCKRLEIREEDRWGHRKSLHSNNTLLTLDCEEGCCGWRHIASRERLIEMNSESLLGMSGHSQPDKQVVSGLDCMCIGDRHKKMKAFLCERAQNNNSAEQMYCNLGPVYPQCTERNAAGVSVHGQFDLVSACCCTCLHVSTYPWGSTQSPLKFYVVALQVVTIYGKICFFCLISKRMKMFLIR